MHVAARGARRASHPKALMLRRRRRRRLEARGLRRKALVSAIKRGETHSSRGGQNASLDFFVKDHDRTDLDLAADNRNRANPTSFAPSLTAKSRGAEDGRAVNGVAWRTAAYAAISATVR